MRRVAGLLNPGGFLGIETEAVEMPGAPDAAFFEFFPGSELSGDASNWWAPNARALQGLTQAAGLTGFELLAGPPPLSRFARFQARLWRRQFRYRAIARAYSPEA